MSKRKVSNLSANKIEEELETEQTNYNIVNNEDSDIKPTKWDDDFEKICTNLADEAQINTYLHIKSHRYYSKWSRSFQIPIILLSAIGGSANFASDNFGSQKNNVILAVGGISIIISVISSIAQYLKLAELKESHRISSFHWEKFFNKIRVQLMLKRESRRRLPDFYDDLINEYQRLKEISPIFQRKIESSAKKKKGYEHLNVPFYLNGFSPVIPYEKSEEDFNYYFLTNNSDKFIYNKKTPNKRPAPPYNGIQDNNGNEATPPNQEPPPPNETTPPNKEPSPPNKEPPPPATPPATLPATQPDGEEQPKSNPTIIKEDNQMNKIPSMPNINIDELLLSPTQTSNV